MNPFWIFDFGFWIRRAKAGKFLGSAIATLLFAFSNPVGAQQSAKVARIGYLASLIGDMRFPFEQGLRELGYVDGKNIIIEWRANEGNLDRNPSLAAELVRLNVDVIVAAGSGEIRAAKEATSLIPIVMVRGGDPIGSGLVASLAKPGGNITGLAILRPELSGKRLELIKEIVPKLSRVAVFASPTSADYRQVLKEIEIAAAPLGVKVQPLNILTPKDLETSFQDATKARADAVLFRVPGPNLSSHRTKITELALKSQLPVMYESAQEVDAGGLMSYGVNGAELYKRAAIYVDKILKGAKPADLPIEQPTKFELVINLKTAKQIGVAIPPNVLARADRVIR